MISPNLLRITSRPALIDIKRSPSKLDIEQPKAEVKMQIKDPKVEISTKKPKVHIDQTECFADVGLKFDERFVSDFANYSKQKAMEGLNRIVSQGNQLADIENKGKVLPDQAHYNAFNLFLHEFGYDTVPKHRPRIQLERGKVNFNFQRGKVDINVKVNKPKINYTRSEVQIYLKQKNSVKIEYLGNRVDSRK